MTRRNKNKWWLNGGRESGRTFRLLCEVYENKIADLQHKVDTLQGFLDHDIEYDMDKTIQELRKKNAELESDFRICEKNADTYYDQLTKAKGIIKNLMYTPDECIAWYDLCDKAKQFLRETDIDNAIQKANEGLDLDKIADEVEQDIKKQKVK